MNHPEKQHPHPLVEDDHNKSRQPVIAFLGADGSGKSSVIEQLIASSGDTYDVIECFHVRPRLDHKQTKGLYQPVPEPHANPKRGWLFSTLKLIYFWLDYQLGFLLRVHPVFKNAHQANQNALVIFDRYFHDLLVDTKRYRYGGSMDLARLIGHWVPKPTLFILLDASADVLQSRKQEVPFEETVRQREAYRTLVEGFSNGVIIDASQPLEAVVQAVKESLAEVSCLE